MIDQIHSMFNSLMSLLDHPAQLLKIVQFLLAIILVLLCAYCIYLYRSDKKNKERIFKGGKVKKGNQERLFADFVFKELYQNILVLYTQKGKGEAAAKKCFYAILLIFLALFLYLCSVGQMFLGLIFTVGLKFALDHITGTICLNFSDYMELQIPLAIDNITRIFSKVDDVRSILYESSLDLPQPLQGILQSLSSQMALDAPDVVLNRFMDVNSNPYAYTMIFILYNYTRGADKRDTILNLRDLKLSLENEKKIGMQERMERRMTVTINYVLCGVALAALMLNLTFNPTASAFFFSTLTGIALFIVGILLIVVSIFFNVMIMRGKK